MTHYPTTATSVVSGAEHLNYRDLHSIARHLMANESCRCTLTATGLVHEFYLRLAKHTIPSPDTPNKAGRNPDAGPPGTDPQAAISEIVNPERVAAHKLPAETPSISNSDAAIAAKIPARVSGHLATASVTTAAAMVQVSGTGNLALASRVMKQILVDRARRRHTRRTAEQSHCVQLGSLSARSQKQQVIGEKTLQFESALEILEREMPETAELVRLRVYLDVSIEAPCNWAYPEPPPIENGPSPKLGWQSTCSGR